MTKSSVLASWIIRLVLAHCLEWDSNPRTHFKWRSPGILGMSCQAA